MAGRRTVWPFVNNLSEKILLDNTICSLMPGRGQRIERLQRVQNALARLVVGTRRSLRAGSCPAPLATHQSKSDIQDQTDTSTIVRIGYDRRKQAAAVSSIHFPAAT